MFNKIMVGSLTAALLFGGAFQTTADASASTGSSQDQSQNQSYQHKVYYSVNGSDWTEHSNDRFGNYLNKYFPQINWNWDKLQNNHEQPKQDKPEQNQEQPENNNDSTQQQDKSEQQESDKQEDQQTEQPKAEAPQQPAEQQDQQNQSQSQQLNEFEQQVVELTNQERQAQGLEPLKVDTELSKVAREKSRDMAANNYFSHDSPTYGSPFDMMKQYGISYRTAGENIAKGQRTPQQVVDGWMNSEGHRENIMNPNFTHIGVGYVEQGNHWTQQFIGK
ncbi:CAP domain-containing protein [Lentibacillus sp.]|uniref:CAP domain-containing protein n=1 Tax=Lentibacillus sp. TaxID=1925746 RepID=UPI002B4AAFC3|nr:CAP domain-containing protein [Lentibacillus sp.]HLS09710.1 CAP domain-containing protein [Lentibacillus sp.]